MSDRSPSADGWISAERPRDGRFSDQFAGIAVRVEGEARARVRMPVGEAQANIGGSVHGGFLMALADQSLFIAPAALGRLPAWGVTLNLAMTFIGTGSIGVPGQPQAVDVIVDIVGETGRLLFLRGLMEQDGRTVATFDGTVRKFSQSRQR